MRTLEMNEVQQVSGAAEQISGYAGAGAVLTVLGSGAAMGPVGVPVMVVAGAVAAGLAIAQFLSDLK
ncbi:MAG: hypothetical protein ACOY3E_15015 [Pseudomonadota bacterium]